MIEKENEKYYSDLEKRKKLDTVFYLFAPPI